MSFFWQIFMGILICLRCARAHTGCDPDDWVNGVLGGLASGAVLGHLHGTTLLYAFEWQHIDLSNPTSPVPPPSSPTQKILFLWHYQGSIFPVC